KYESESRTPVRSWLAGYPGGPPALRAGFRQSDHERLSGHGGTGRIIEWRLRSKPERGNEWSAATVDRAGNLERRAWRLRHGRRFGPGRAARNARADFQSIFHVEEGWS